MLLLTVSISLLFRAAIQFEYETGLNLKIDLSNGHHYSVGMRKTLCGRTRLDPNFTAEIEHEVTIVWNCYDWSLKLD